MGEGIALLEEIVRQLKLIHEQLVERKEDPVQRDGQKQWVVDHNDPDHPKRYNGKMEYLIEWLRENDQPELSTRKMAELIPFPVSHVLVGKARRELHATDV